MAEPCDFETAIALTGFGRFNLKLIVAAFLSAMVVVWDTNTIAYVIPQAECDLNLSSIDKGALNAIIYAGLISSALLWGSISDTIGRVRLLKFSLFVDGVFVFCSAFSTSLWMLLLLRFFVGVMGCTALSISMTVVAEFHGMKYRSRCIMAVGFYIGASLVLLPALGLAILMKSWEYDMGALKLRPWNAFIMLCSLPCLVGSLVYAFLPETPKFLMAQGKNEEALTIMRKMYATNTGNHPDAYPVESLGEQGEAVPSGRLASLTPGNVLVSRVLAGCNQVVALFSTKYRRYMALVLFIQSCDLLSLNTVRLWLPQLFTTLEEFYEMQRLNGSSTPVYLCDAVTAHRDQRVSFRSLALNATNVQENVCVPPLKTEKIYINSMIMCSIVALIIGVSGILVKLLDYKWVIICCFLLSSIFCVSVLGSTSLTSTVALFTVYLATVNIIITCMLGVVATIFPTKLRATAVSFTMMNGYLAALIGNLVFPLVMELRCEIPFYTIACIQLVAGLASFALPYTKGRPLT